MIEFTNYVVNTDSFFWAAKNGHMFLDIRIVPSDANFNFEMKIRLENGGEVAIEPEKSWSLLTCDIERIMRGTWIDS
jgi:hypothetical protein